MLIDQVNGKPVTSAEDFAEIANNLPTRGFVPIRIVREGQATTLALELAP